MIWPWPDLTWPDLRSNFQIDLSSSTSTYMFRTGLTRRTRWCHFYLRISHIKKEVINEKPSPWKRHFFLLMTAGAKTIDLRSNLMGKRYRGMRRAPQCFFSSFVLAIVLLEIKAIVCEEIAIFSKFDLWWPLVASILAWPENGLLKCLRSRCGLSYALYRSSLSSVVFEFGGRGPKRPPSARNWTFQSPPGIGLKLNR